MISMRLPAKIWSTNEDRNLNPHARAQLIKDWKEAVFWHYRQNYGKQPQEPSIVHLTLPVKSKRRRDPHNYCGTVLKAIIDGLVHAGAWPDDTPEYVGHREPIFYVGEEVIITWEPIPPTTTSTDLDVDWEAPSDATTVQP